MCYTIIAERKEVSEMFEYDYDASVAATRADDTNPYWYEIEFWFQPKAPVNAGALVLDGASSVIKIEDAPYLRYSIITKIFNWDLWIFVQFTESQKFLKKYRFSLDNGKNM